MNSIKDILNTHTVNSKYNNSSTTVNSNKTITEKICSYIEENNIEPEAVALILSDLLDDKRSLPYYLLLAKEHNNGALIELAHQVKERAELKLIKTSKPIYFIGILRKKGFKTKFRE